MSVRENNNKLSIIVPIFNEEKSINILYDKIKEALTGFEDKKEIIFIDDGSTDSSANILGKLSNLDGNVKVFSFPSNRGQHKAIEKGFQEAQGEIIITMDGDLQCDPLDIPKLVAKLNQGFAVVCGWRMDRKDHGCRIYFAKLGSYIQRKITKINLHDMGCGMRAYRQNIVKHLTFENKYEIGLLPYILSRQTSKITEINITHNKRVFGKSNYFLSYILGTIYCYIKLILTKNKH